MNIWVDGANRKMKMVEERINEFKKDIIPSDQQRVKWLKNMNWTWRLTEKAKI